MSIKVIEITSKSTQSMAFNSEYVQEQIKLGIKTHKAGDNLRARLHFQVALREDTTNIPALLWLAYIDTDHERQIVLLERVLKLDPDNERAAKGLLWVKRQITEAEKQADAGPSQEVDAQSDASSTSLEDIKQQLETGELKEQARKGTIAQRARRRMNPLIALLIGGAIVLSAVLWHMLFLTEQPSLAALAPSNTPTTGASASATSTPHLIHTATSAATDTPTRLPPSQTPAIPTATSLPPTPTPMLQSLAYEPAYLGEKWIEVDLDSQTLIAWEGDQSVMKLIVSTGLPNTPTIEGQFRIYQKLTSTRMTGPGYDLPNVPHTMYFQGGYALHGAYWHNNFGQPMSHGCVNMSPDDAETLFAWAGPVMPEDSWYIYATNDNPGTPVVVHQ